MFEQRKLDARLKTALTGGDVDGVRDALKDGADPNAEYGVVSSPNRPLKLAFDAKHNGPEMMRMLLQAGADPNYHVIGPSLLLQAVLDKKERRLTALLECARTDLDFGGIRKTTGRGYPSPRMIARDMGLLEFCLLFENAEDSRAAGTEDALKLAKRFEREAGVHDMRAKRLRDRAQKLRKGAGRTNKFSM